MADFGSEACVSHHRHFAAAVAFSPYMLGIVIIEGVIHSAYGEHSAYVERVALDTHFAIGCVNQVQDFLWGGPCWYDVQCEEGLSRADICVNNVDATFFKGILSCNKVRNVFSPNHILLPPRHN